MMEKTLPEVCIIQYGFPFDSSKFCSAEGVPLVRIRDVVRGYSETYTTEIAGENYIVNDGDLLIGMDGEFNIAYWKGGRAYLNQRVCRLIPREDVDRDYIFYYMPQALKAIEDATPFVTVKHLSAKQLSKILIPLPDMSEQQRISAVLRSVDRVIAMRKKELDELNNLVKSRFIELFGDSEFNTMQWPTEKLSELCVVSSSKRIYQNEQSTEGVPFLRISDLNERIDNVKNAPELFIPINKYNELKENGLVPTEGDILVTSRGTLGRCYIVRPEDEFYFQDGMISWLSDLSHQITSLYLSQLFAMSGIQKQIASLQAGSTVAYLSISMLKKLDIMLPPLNLQNQFAVFVEQTDKSKLFDEMEVAA